MYIYIMPEFPYFRKLIRRDDLYGNETTTVLLPYTAGTPTMLPHVFAWTMRTRRTNHWP